MHAGAGADGVAVAGGLGGRGRTRRELGKVGKRRVGEKVEKLGSFG